MLFFPQGSVDNAAFVVPWTHLAGSIAVVTILAFLSQKLIVSPTHKNGVPLPPGPPATWFWENPMPKQGIAPRLAAWVHQFGPVFSLRCGSNLTVVIGRMEAATEIMEKEGGSLADRPRMIAIAEILSGGMRLSTQPAGDHLRRLRRAVHTHLHPNAAETYKDIQAEAAKQVIVDILNDPECHIQHAQRYAASVALRILYGKTSPTTYDDPDMVRVRQVALNFQSAVRQGKYLVDFIPWLKYVPWYGRKLREFHQYELVLYRDQFNRVKVDMAADRAGPSFVRALLEHTNDHMLSNDEMAYLAGGSFGASSDTTASGISVMIMAAACHPNAQAHVQDELDEVVGKDRVPTFGDWGMLPQLQAFLLEAMRWRPVAPLGFSHRATKDIIWKGQCIPAGATVIGCHWAISRDPEAFPDPETFNPGRWLTEEGRIRTDMHFYTYGFGRRVCPGRHIADQSLFINLALLLWSFHILQWPDAPIDTHASAVRDVIVFRPKPFDVSFVPRMKESRLRELMA